MDEDNNNLAGDSSLETEESTPEPTATKPTELKPKKDKSKLIAWALVGLLAISTGIFAWLYFTKETEPQEQAEEQTTETEQTDDESETDDEVAAARVNYEADVGKFKLELDADFLGVFEKLDDNFEGGPATSIEIGEKAKNTHGFYVTSPGQSFTIFARPEAGASLETNTRTAALEANELAERQDDDTFKDEPARVYQENGLFSVNHVVFVKNGIVYEVSYLSESEMHASMLRAVEAGFSFVD